MKTTRGERQRGPPDKIIIIENNGSTNPRSEVHPSPPLPCQLFAILCLGIVRRYDFSKQGLGSDAGGLGYLGLRSFSAVVLGEGSIDAKIAEAVRVLRAGAPDTCPGPRHGLRSFGFSWVRFSHLWFETGLWTSEIFTA